MDKDSLQMGFSLNNFGKNSNDFVLPNDFDESKERIIALVTYMYFGYEGHSLDYHYYLRNGNGTCPNGHGGNCSMWSHKVAGGVVQNTCCGNDKIILCDNNIGGWSRYMSSLINSPYSMHDETRYYKITKNTSLYDSWFTNGHYADSTGTFYYNN